MQIKQQRGKQLDDNFISFFDKWIASILFCFQLFILFIPFFLSSSRSYLEQ